MDPAADNEYMNKELKGIAITVYATQDTVESDSFNNTYDENATYPVVNVTDLKEALTNGGVVLLPRISRPTTLRIRRPASLSPSPPH